MGESGGGESGVFILANAQLKLPYPVCPFILHKSPVLGRTFPSLHVGVQTGKSPSLLWEGLGLLPLTARMAMIFQPH